MKINTLKNFLLGLSIISGICFAFKYNGLSPDRSSECVLVDYDDKGRIIRVALDTLETDSLEVYYLYYDLNGVINRVTSNLPSSRCGFEWNPIALIMHVNYVTHHKDSYPYVGPPLPEGDSSVVWAGDEVFADIKGEFDEMNRVVHIDCDSISLFYEYNEFNDLCHIGIIENGDTTVHNYVFEVRVTHNKSYLCF